MYRVNNGGLKMFLGILIGIVAAAAIFCVAVGIGCAVNGVTFGQQIVNWFGGGAKEVAETVETVAALAL